MPLDVRTIEATELAAWLSAMAATFFHDSPPGYADWFLPEVDLSRTWASFDGERVVGTLRSFANVFTAPGGGQVPAAALTNVTVLGTHHRRGLLSRMITADLEASAERGETIGILIASEYPIYGRFGYGPAVEGAKYRIDTRGSRFRRAAAGSVEQIDLATLRREAPPLYERLRAVQPGAIRRSDRWWDRTLRQIEVPGDEKPTGYCALYRSESGSPEGYVRYRVDPTWQDMIPDGLLHLDEMVATNEDAYEALWQYVCGIDLVRTIEAHDRPVDEVLPYLLSDGRAVRQVSRYDFVWVRVLDVCAALSGRRYGSEKRMVIEVVDRLGFANGRYVLDAAEDGATCFRTQAEADLTMPVDSLGAIYAGGTPLRVLAEAGRIDEHRPGALREASLLFASYRAPWTSTWF